MRYLIISDLHSNLEALQAVLAAAEGEYEQVICCGDLVGYGPDPDLIVDWVRENASVVVRGNHDDYVCRFDTCDIGNWMYNGGSWFVGIPTVEQQCMQIVFNELPLAIEVETDAGLIGIVHADVPGGSWRGLPNYFANRNGRNYVMWSRNRFEMGDDSGVDGVRAVICGHTPLRAPVVLGNVYHIDTAGWTADGYFTLINLQTLEAIPPIPHKLDWE